MDERTEKPVFPFFFISNTSAGICIFARHNVIRPTTSMTTLKTADENRVVMDALNFEEIASYYDHGDSFEIVFNLCLRQ